MTRKKLPPAISRLAAERREKDADELVVDEGRKRQRSQRASAKRHRDETAAEPAAAQDAPIAPEPEPEAEPSQPLTGELIPPDSEKREPQKEERRAAAEKLVDRYKLYAGLGGLVPMPAINVAALTALNVRMVKALSDLYGVPFESNQVRSVVVGLVGGSVPTGLGYATGSMLGLLMPAGAFVGFAVSSLTAAALTRNIGLVFIDYFESGETPPTAAPPTDAQPGA